MTSVPTAMLNFWNDPYTRDLSHDKLLLGCKIDFAAVTLFDMVGVLLECQIAIGFTMVHFRKFGAVSLLNRSILFTWLIGLGSAGASFFGMDFSDDLQMCKPKTGGGAHEIIPLLVGLTCCISLVSYCVTLCASKCDGRDPGSVVNRIITRSKLYPLNFFLSYGPAMIINAVPTVFYTDENIRTSRIVAYTALYANGFLNALTYAWVFRGARRLVSRQPIIPSFMPQNNSDEDPLGFASFHVRFEEAHIDGDSRKRVVRADRQQSTAGELDKYAAFLQDKDAVTTGCEFLQDKDANARLGGTITNHHCQKNAIFLKADPTCFAAHFKSPCGYPEGAIERDNSNDTQWEIEQAEEHVHA